MVMVSGSVGNQFNSLPNDKILDWSNLKAFVDDKIKVTENLKFVHGRVENIVGKGKNTGFQHFVLFPLMFSKSLFLKVVKSWDYMVKSSRVKCNQSTLY